MKNIVIGAVNSTRFLLETMMKLNIDISYVFSLVIDKNLHFKNMHGHGKSSETL